MALGNNSKQSSFPSPSRQLQNLVDEYSKVTSASAVAAWKKAHLLHASHPTSPSAELTNSWKSLIDGAAASAMIDTLHSISFRTKKVGSEGDKEVYYAGEAAPSVKGEFGDKKHPVMWGISDVVERTTALSQLKPGALTALAISEENGIMATPVGVHYMMKLIGPPQARNIMSLDIPHEENLDRLIQKLDIKPSELIQVTLNPANRFANLPFVEAAKKVGVTVKIIDAGDTMPSLLAVMDPHTHDKGPHIVVGRGGFEEGTIAAAAAHAMGGFMEARVFNKDPETMKKNPVLTLHDLIPGDPKNTLVSITGITQDEWLGIAGIERKEDKLLTETYVFTHTGIIKRHHTHPV